MKSLPRILVTGNCNVFQLYEANALFIGGFLEQYLVRKCHLRTEILSGVTYITAIIESFRCLPAGLGVIEG